MMRVRIIKRIKSAFRFVEKKYGFALIEENYYPESFGNVIIKYQSKDLIFVVCRDRFEFYSLFIPLNDPKVEYNDFLILRYLNKKDDYVTLFGSSPKSLRKFAKILKRNFLEILTLFEPENYALFSCKVQQTLEEIKEKSLQRFGIK